MQASKDEDLRLVEALYAGILRRAGEPTSVAHWVSMLHSGQLTPAGVAAAFLASDEFQNSVRVPLFVPPGHFYSPIVDPVKAAARLDRPSTLPIPDALPGIAVDRTRMRAMWHRLLPYLASAPFTETAKTGLRYRYDNPAYSFGDGSILQAMLRYYKPKRVVEVGSGWSSVCTIDTVEMFLKGQCKLTFIEPHPQLFKDLIGKVSMHVEILAHRVEETPLAVFDALDAGDILFIDSTHVLATASDVCFELFEILPRLKPGVLVHFHDMFWPFEYPRAWAVDENRSWNELYAVRALLTDNPCWEILFFNDYFGRVETKTASETFPIFLKNPGGALWLVKKEANRRDRPRAAVAAGKMVADTRVADLVVAGLDDHRPNERESSVRPARPVRRIGAGVSYADGAESEVLAALRRSGDVSWASDELQEHIVDWPTLVHFSYQRTHLLKPLRIGPGMRVLDVGAGTGALTRHVAEQGAEVVALEGNMMRAEAAAERCRDLDGVDVLCGSLDDLDPNERFDLVLLVGVLEYAGAVVGGSGGGLAMLRRARSHLREGGVVALAIENQLGLKYLLGGREDHLAKPWVGIDGYPGPPGIRTWSRGVLRAMLAEAGLVEQHWLAPFPDYKLPTVVLDERLYERADAAELIDQLVLHPVAFHDQAPLRLADAAAAHRVWAEAGKAADVANSFLVVAGPEGAALADIVPQDTLAWMFGSFRQPPWRRERRLTDDMRLVTVGDARPRHREWIGRDPGEERPFVRGRTLAHDALDAVRAHDLNSLGAVLRRWRDELAARSVETGEISPGVHPFLLPDATRGLPGGLLDASLANFVQASEGLTLIDDGWHTRDPVDRRVAEYRALWSLAVDIVSRGIVHPWGETATVDDIVGQLLDLTGLTVEPHVVTAWRQAELELQHLIAGSRAAETTAGWIDGTRTSADVRPQQRADVDLERLRDELPRLRAEADRLEGERARLTAECAEYLGQRDHFEDMIAAQQVEIDSLRATRGFVGQLVRRNRLLRAIAARVGLIRERGTG